MKTIEINDALAIVENFYIIEDEEDFSLESILYDDIATEMYTGDPIIDSLIFLTNALIKLIKNIITKISDFTKTTIKKFQIMNIEKKLKKIGDKGIKIENRTLAQIESVLKYGDNFIPVFDKKIQAFMSDYKQFLSRFKKHSEEEKNMFLDENLISQRDKDYTSGFSYIEPKFITESLNKLMTIMKNLEKSLSTNTKKINDFLRKQGTFMESEDSGKFKRDYNNSVKYLINLTNDSFGKLISVTNQNIKRIQNKEDEN